jgi:hypothetical protein
MIFLIYAEKDTTTKCLKNRMEKEILFKRLDNNEFIKTGIKT